jgi:hypothetical protein
MKLVSMKIAPKEMEAASKMPASDPYPYGLRLELSDDVLEALGISKLSPPPRTNTTAKASGDR